MIKLHQPNILLLELGTNDGLRGFAVDSITLELQKMIDLFMSENFQIVI